MAVPGSPVPEGTQLSLPLDPHEGPELRALTAWERMLADYGSTGVTLREHPLELMRPDLPGDLRTSEQLERHPDGRRVRVAGLVVARQRPATAKGVTFMLLEDEHGTINLIVPPPVHDRFRLAVRTEPLVLATGRLERREGTTNVLVDRIERLERPDLPRAEIRHIEPRRVWSSEAGEGVLGRRTRPSPRAPRPTCGRWRPPATASAGGGAEATACRRSTAPAARVIVAVVAEVPRLGCLAAPPPGRRLHARRASASASRRAAGPRPRSTSPPAANAPPMRSP